MQFINSRPFQRLRHIHQLAMTYLVYPGACHKRFEHSLGVMELAGRAFDSVTSRDNVDENARRLFPEITTNEWLIYWRKVLRLAALAHDIGHPPFSHAAEKELLPKGVDHEVMTRRLLESDEMQEMFGKMIPPVKGEHVVKLSLGKKARDLKFTIWEELLAEIITGDSLGVDRMDYLLRDAYHAGVAYGKFDHFRLLETIRIVPPPPVPYGSSSQTELSLGLESESTLEPMLGLLIGGIHSSEALLLARYFMYAQVYFHRVRIAYNHHLKEFLKAWLEGGMLPTDIEMHLALTDNEVNSAILLAARNSAAPGHGPARRIVERTHFKRLFEFSPKQVEQDPLLPAHVREALKVRYSENLFVFHQYFDNKDPQSFPVKLKNGETASSIAHSAVLQNYPKLSLNFILADESIKQDASGYLKSNFGLTS